RVKKMIPKFRAWEPDVKYMNDQVRVTSNRFGSGEVWVEATESFGWTELRPEHLMQSTGLKDKNGVEIFEGDVLYYIPFESHINDSIVVFEKGSFCKKMLRNGKLTSVKFIDSEEYEVIGNIHENPELLEVAE
ncbi:YopX family protein, partial [Enterococcus faecalis]|uniref:YopX family protein n=2 Tax=Enterococcus faecalis TaxID=1351 RepID=UPI0039C8A2F2